MKPLLPGQAALARIDEKVALVACELKGVIPDGPGRCDLRGGLHQIRIANVMVPLYAVNPFRCLLSQISEFSEHPKLRKFPRDVSSCLNYG